ncbi:MAG: hypothetical protein ACO2PM_06365 [Pyrobaculum sp.]|jgi:hypothetical protein
MTRQVAIFVGVVLAATAVAVVLGAGGREAELYLVVGYLGPFGKVDAALEELQKYAVWASWVGSVGIAIEDGKSAALRMLSMSCEGRKIRLPNGTVKNAPCLRLEQAGGPYVLVYRDGSKTLRFRGDTLEDALWLTLQHDEVDKMTKGWVETILLQYLFDVPLSSAAWALPFCNGTYYGPPRPKVAVDAVIRAFIYPENKTVKPEELPRYVELPLRPLGPSWFGHYVVDACALDNVRKEGVVAIVTKDKVETVLKTLQKYTDGIYIKPIK